MKATVLVNNHVCQEEFDVLEFLSGEEDQIVVRVALLFEPGESLRVRLHSEQAMDNASDPLDLAAEVESVNEAESTLVLRFPEISAADKKRVRRAVTGSKLSGAAVKRSDAVTKDKAAKTLK